MCATRSSMASASSALLSSRGTRTFPVPVGVRRRSAAPCRRALRRSRSSCAGAPKSRPKILEKVARLETLKKQSALTCQCSSTGSSPGRNTPVLDAARVDARDVVDRGHVELADDLRSFEILAVMDVLDHHHADEFLVPVVVVEGELDQRVSASSGDRPSVSSCASPSRTCR